MAKCLPLSILALMTSLLFTNGTNITEQDTDSMKISLLPEMDSPLDVSDNDTSILRYGFHRTHDCNDFEKSFVCIRKCLDLNYHIAQADKDCMCTCYKNSILAKYKMPIAKAFTKWKFGGPTTSRPAWAGGPFEKKPDDYEINANYTEYIGVPKKTTPPTEAPTTVDEDSDDEDDDDDDKDEDEEEEEEEEEKEEGDKE